MGLVALGRVAIDGSHFKANTSKHKAMSHEYMVRAIETIKSELAALRASLKDSNAREATSEAPLLTGEIARREKRLAKIEEAKRTGGGGSLARRGRSPAESSEVIRRSRGFAGAERSQLVSVCLQHADGRG